MAVITPFYYGKYKLSVCVPLTAIINESLIGDRRIAEQLEIS